MICHHTAFIDLAKVDGHVPIKFPNEQSCVTYKHDSSLVKYIKVLGRVENIRQDESGKRRNFELTVEFLNPFCSVAKKVAA